MVEYRDGAVITVGEIVREALPPGTGVAAGDAFLGRAVSAVAAVRPRPASLGDLRGGELVLLSTEALAALDPSPSLARVVESLAGKASAVAVRGALSSQAIDVANRYRIALLTLPPGPPLTTLEREVQAYLAEQRTVWYQRRHAVSHELMALALEQRGVQAIAERMRAISGCAVVFRDAAGSVLAAAIPLDFPLGQEEVIAWAESKHGADRATASRQALPGHDIATLQAPVVVRSETAGVAAVLGSPERIDAGAHLVLEAGATAAAIELAREHAVQETVHRIQGDLVSDLVLGTGDSADIAHRAARMGYDMDALRVAFTLQLDGGQQMASTALRRLRRLPASGDPGSVPYSRVPIYAETDRLTLFPEIAAGTADEAILLIADTFRRALQIPDAPVGVSRPHVGADSFQLGHEEAVQALTLGRVVAPDRTIMHYGDLGVYRLLASASRGQMEEFQGKVLGSLLAYDRKRHGQLTPTLETYVRSANAAEAAARLNLHRNSLLYRLRRIREITGLDLDDPDTRFALQLAFRVRETLRVTEP